jgi:hypothetical protein
MNGRQWVEKKAQRKDVVDESNSGRGLKGKRGDGSSSRKD